MAPRQWQNRIVGHGEEDPEQLLANPGNWRIHPRTQQAALEGILQKVGWVQNVIVNQRTGHIIDGHARVEIAISRGERVPVVYVDLSEAEERAILAVYDRLTAMAGTDEEKLAELIADAQADFPDLGRLLANITEVLGDVEPQPVAGGLTDPDAVPDPPAEPVTRLGDLWLCGPHRVLCGDSTAPEAVLGACGAAVGLCAPFLMVTDPPYGVEYDPAWRAEHDGGNRHATGKFQNDDRVDWREAYALFPGNVMYLWHAGVYAGEVATGICSVDFQIRAQIIWRKQHFVFSRGAYHWQHEPCWYAVRKGEKANWLGDRTQSTVWDVQNANPHGGAGQQEQTGHGTQKPVELMRRPILNHTAAGDAVYDPFLGSGTTLIACEETDRVCYGLDVEPKYVDVTVLRWQNFTGKAATLEGDGRTFAEVSRERIGSAEAVPA